MFKGNKNVAIKLLLITICYTHRSYQDLAQPSSEKLPPAADGNKYRDPQPDIMQRVRDLGTLRPKRNVTISFLASGLSKS